MQTKEPRKQIYIRPANAPVWDAVVDEATQAGVSVSDYVAALLTQRTQRQAAKALVMSRR